MLHAGLDLSRRRLDVCVISELGELVEEIAAPPDAGGLRYLVGKVARRVGRRLRRRDAAGECLLRPCQFLAGFVRTCRARQGLRRLWCDVSHVADEAGFPLSRSFRRAGSGLARGRTPVRAERRARA